MISQATHFNWYLSIALSILFTSISNTRSQYISHINAKGVKGQISFDVRQEANESVLVIEASIESNHLETEPIVEDEEIDESIPVQFEWIIHSQPVDPSLLQQTCSEDELGPTTVPSLWQNRLLVINKPTSWSVPLQEFLKNNSATSLGALIWGRSIKLKLSSVHREKIEPKVTPHVKESGETLPLSPTAPKDRKPAISIGKPLRPFRPTTAPAPIKPTFAPRPKPNIRAKVTSSSVLPLPKAEALVLATPDASETISSTNATITANETTNSSVTTDTTISSSTKTTTTAPPIVEKSRDAIIASTNRRIAKVFQRTVLCANIIDNRDVKTAEAVFEAQVSGKVTFRGNEDDVTLIMVNLYHLKSKITTRYDWKILASDILDNRRHGDQCRYLQIVLDPTNKDDTECKKSSTSQCHMGDLTKKHGQVQVAGLGKSSRSTMLDLNLPLSALEGSRSLFLVIYEASAPGKVTKDPQILTCAKINSVVLRKVEAVFNMDGVRGSIKMSQRHPTEPTSITYDLFGLEGSNKHLTIKELPLDARSSSENAKLCANLGAIYNPHKLETSWASVGSTVDRYPVGNLSAKIEQLSVIDSEYEDHYMGDFIDPSVHLYGVQTVAGRSIVIHKNNGEPWVCSTLDYADEPVNLAVATFYYPVVGRISFRQLANSPHAETGVLIDVYNPNTDRGSDGHNWLVHLKPAMADIYNWSQRCESTGEVYDPIQTSSQLSGDTYSRQCLASITSEPLRCRSGDTSLKSGYKLNLPVSHLNKTRLFYTDLFLPLSKAHSLIGRSVVIYDEHSPTQRGNRLACSTIKSVHPLKAVVKSWDSGPSIPSNVLGSMVFQQDSAEKSTQIKIDLSGFNGNVENYAIHNVWTMEDREFPCSNDSLYDIYDPYDNENSQRLPPSAHYGSLATVDRVKVGDLSRKHGTFESLRSVQKLFIDANAPLFAPNSIIGRSVVLRAAVNDFRWVCGSIELDYDKNEAREIIGMASFDEPRSKIAGYVKFRQIEHKDGSLSDTYVQVDLKMQSDGVHELQTSRGHNWAVFVNQVGEDAYITADEVRCIASGFKWNPYLAQDGLEPCGATCSPSEQLAFAMGDLGLRHGALTLGPNNRRAFSDTNLPLAGNYSIMGRSLVIFDNKRPSVKLACANIHPSIHLKSNVVIKRTPTFTVSKFVEQMRTLLEAADWLLVPELRATKPVANGECVQMTIHFYGSKAHQMQTEMNNLVALGTVLKSSRTDTKKISTHFKLCRAGQMQLTSSSSPIWSSYTLILIAISMLMHNCHRLN